MYKGKCLRSSKSPKLITVELLQFHSVCDERVQSGLSAMQDVCMVQAICLAGDDTDVYHMPLHRLTSTVWVAVCIM